jgi:hypothetical protein
MIYDNYDEYDDGGLMRHQRRLMDLTKLEIH